MLVDQRTRATVKLVDDPYVVVPSLQINVGCEHKRWKVSACDEHVVAGA